MADLHITNGDGAADLLKDSTVSGDVLPWRDPMHHGPFPDGPDLDAVSEVRARYLGGDNVETDDALRGFRLRDDHLRAAGRYERVILWFEHDLLDQLQILQILDWFADADLHGTELDIICINAFEGIENFRGLGQLSPEQIATLICQKVPVTASMLSLAQAGWSAFRADTPVALTTFLDGDTSALPFLGAALRRHLLEYPDSRSGLARTEHQMLRLVAGGVTGPVEMFVQNMDFETALFIGDWPSYDIIAQLTHSGLLRCETGAFRYPPRSRDEVPEFRKQRFALTSEGRAVLAGDRDAFSLIPRDQWLGGVRISSAGAMWTWNRTTNAAELRPI